MNTQEFDRLRAHIQTYGKQHGVEAHVWKEDTPGSDVTPVGTRIQLQVLRRIEGQPAREHPHKVAGYRPDAPDLQAVLERDIREAARDLHAKP